jgi:hypothetical protein
MYDEKIAPLVKQITAICNEHDLPMICVFQLASDGDEEFEFAWEGVLPDEARTLSVEFIRMYGMLVRMKRKPAEPAKAQANERYVE